MNSPDALLLLLTAGCFVALVVAARLPVSLSLAVASVALALAAGRGVPLPHLVEGMFSYLDVSLVILTAMVFMKVIEANGLLTELTQGLIALLGGSRALLLVALTVVIMFPGMITGSCTASVLGTGAIVAPVLMRMGLPRATAGAVISSAAVYGMIAPPVNVPVMIIGGGIDMPYVGFGLVLTVLTVGPAILTIGGDILTAIDGQPITSDQELLQFLDTQTEVGDTIQVTLWRDGQEMTVAITLDEMPR